jgi:hypothetical protein
MSIIINRDLRLPFLKDAVEQEIRRRVDEFFIHGNGEALSLSANIAALLEDYHAVVCMAINERKRKEKEQTKESEAKG